MDGIKIKNGGALTTIQDKGRYGAQQTGFGPCGVMDEKSFNRISKSEISSSVANGMSWMMNPPA